MALSSSSNLRTFFFSVLLLLLFVSSVQAIVSSTYVLDTEYSGPTFFDGFEFWTDPDPTHGFVSYQSQSSSLSKSLISTSNNVARMSVDSRTVLRSDGSEGGRESVRISSKKRFTHGLFLADVEHMPGSECGVWPAYWMFGPDWPNGGEIDIIEGVSLQQTNVMTLHTGDTCTISGTQSLGTLQTNDCNQNNGYGCSISSSSPISYGDSFNSANGGVYATQWTSDYIRIWYFPRSSIPEDIVNGEPDPSNWGLPDGNFQGNCDVDANFAEHQIVFDTTFCGDWAGSVWSGDPVCSKKANTCVDYVASEPGAFADAYWDINYVKVFTLTDEPAPTSTLVASSSSSKITSTLVTSGSTSKETSKDATSNSTSKSTSTLDTSSSTSKSTSPTVSISTLKSISKPDSTTHLTSTTEPSSLQSRTTRPSAPTPFATSPQNTTLPKPPTLRGWSYIGCISSSTSNFPAFILSATNENMTDTLCASTCSTSAYLGTFVTSCFCGSDLLDTTTLSDSACTIPCPGIPSQVCGGVRVNSRSSKRSEFEHQHRHLEQPVGALEKRQGLGFILTVYQNGLLLPDPQSLSSSPTPDPSEVHFLPTTGGIPTPSTTLTPLSTLVGIGMGVSSSESTEATAVTSGVHFAPTGTNAAELGSVVTSASPAGTLIGIGKGGGLSISISTSTSTAITILNLDIVAQATTITTVVTTTYTDLCSCAASTLQVFTTTSTLTYTDCGCTATSTAHPVSHPHPYLHAPETRTKHQIPMTTLTRICADCGPDGTVIVTVPCTEPTVIPLPNPNPKEHSRPSHARVAETTKIPSGPESKPKYNTVTEPSRGANNALSTVKPAALIEQTNVHQPAVGTTVGTAAKVEIETVTGLPQAVTVPSSRAGATGGNGTLVVLSNTSAEGRFGRWGLLQWGICGGLGALGVVLLMV